MKMNNQTRITGKRKNYSQVSNHPLQNPELSLKAKGLYAMIESYLSIPNFILYKNTLIKNMKDGKSAFESTWKELKDSGYLIQYKKRNTDTNCFYYEYELLETPHPDFEGMENPVYGKQGSYNNTDTNNTNINNNKPLPQSEIDAYLFFADTEEQDLVHQANRILETGREKITKLNYQECLYQIETAIDEYGIEELNEFIRKYKQEKKQGRSVENFIKYLELYQRGVR